MDTSDSYVSRDGNDHLGQSLGTSGDAVIIVTGKLASGHLDGHILFSEESMFPITTIPGTTIDKGRSNLVLYKTAPGGATFSVGSTNWVGVLTQKNNITQITANAMHELIGTR